MLRLTRTYLRRNSGRSIKFEPYTESDIKNGKNLSNLHLGRLKTFEVEDLEEYDGAVKQRRYNLNSSTPLSTQLNLSTPTTSVDKLYSHVDLEILAHDNKVLNSYMKLMIFCCEELSIEFERMQLRPIFLRQEVLRSKKFHAKFRVEYEHRNYSQVLRLKFLTGTSYNAVVGYFQANIPFGVAMKCHKFELLEAPEGVPIKKLTADQMDNVTKFLKTEVEYEPYMTTKPYIDRKFEEKTNPYPNREIHKVFDLNDGFMSKDGNLT